MVGILIELQMVKKETSGKWEKTDRWGKARRITLLMPVGWLALCQFGMSPFSGEIRVEKCEKKPTLLNQLDCRPK